MRIVYHKTQTREKGLAGWLAPMPACLDNSGFLPADLALWHRLAREQNFQWEQAALPHGFPGFWDRLFLVEESPESQYDVLRNFPHDFQQNLACVAISGEGFHGQRQRPWCALEGNLHLSLSVSLDLQSGPGALVWTMLPAVAVMRALKCLGMPENSTCGIKWVNDVLWNSRKLAGVISSLAIVDGRIRQGFLGIGLNVGKSPDLPVETCYLHQHFDPEQVPLGKVLEAVLAAVADLIILWESGQGEVIIREYREHSLVIGHQVCVMTDPVDGIPQEICRGKVKAIGSDLGLLIEGVESPVLEGRLTVQD